MAWISLPVLVLQPVGGQVVDQVGHEGARPCGRVQDLHVVVGQGLAEVLLQEVVRPPDDEVHHLVGRVDHAQPVRRRRVVRLVEVLVDGLEELLFLGVVGDLVGGPSDDPVVGPQPVDGLPPHVPGEEGALQPVQLTGDVVLLVELVFPEYAEEDVLGQDVLEQHFPHVRRRHGGANGPAAQVQEGRGGFLVLRVLRLGLGDGGPQVLEHGGQVGLELALGLAELLDFRQLVVQEDADEAVQLPVPGHIYPHRLAAVLDQNSGLGVLEDDVVLGVAPVELGLYLGVQVIVGVLGLPVAPGHPQRVLDCAVGLVAWRSPQLRDQHQFFPVVAAIGIEAVLEGRPDVLLVVRTAEVDELPETGAVLVDVEVGGHGGIITLTHSQSPPLQWPRRPHRRPVRGPPELNQSQGEMYISPDHAVGGHPSPSGVNHDFGQLGVGHPRGLLPVDHLDLGGGQCRRPSKTWDEQDVKGVGRGAFSPLEGQLLGVTDVFNDSADMVGVLLWVAVARIKAVPVQGLLCAVITSNHAELGDLGVNVSELTQVPPGLRRGFWRVPRPDQDQRVGGPLHRTPRFLGGIPQVSGTEPFQSCRM